ncbi:MAG: DUF5320 domain-containing protein [Nanoarchaeota archaeon]|nr:DUF5320 domain-containing protein [Nanoarchaeota archaeon]
MPGGDGRGPDGTYINCQLKDENGKFISRPLGRRFWRRGHGRECGRGFGWRWRTRPAYTEPVKITKEQELTALENEAEMMDQEQKELKTELENINKRIEELKKQK